MSEVESDKLLHMEERLHLRIVGQDEALRAVSRAVRRGRAGLKDPRRPSAPSCSSGPPGSGRPELARALAEFLFDDEDAVIRMDMSEYRERHSVSRLIGAPPGYVGYEEGGQLTEAVRRKPYSVVLLDELEKAHPEVFNVLLQVMEDGRLTDSQGHVVDFRSIVLIMTSNVGTSTIDVGVGMGLGRRRARPRSGAPRPDEGYGAGALKQTFRPEFLNRVDEVIVFHALTQEQVTQIVDLLLDAGLRPAQGPGPHAVVSEEAKLFLAKEGFDRALERGLCGGRSSATSKTRFRRGSYTGSSRKGMRIEAEFEDGRSSSAGSRRWRPWLPDRNNRRSKKGKGKRQKGNAYFLPFAFFARTCGSCRWRISKRPPTSAIAAGACSRSGTANARVAGNGKRWASISEPSAPAAVVRRAPTRAPIPVSEVAVAEQPRRPVGLGELDRVLGGGLVPGALVLLAGEPGLGKSTLLLQAANSFASSDRLSLYVSGEESLQQIALRSRRLAQLSRHLSAAGGNRRGDHRGAGAGKSARPADH